MKNSADLGGCYPSRPSASVDNTLLGLQNSSYPTQPHSIIANIKKDGKHAFQTPQDLMNTDRHNFSLSRIYGVAKELLSSRK